MKKIELTQNKVALVDNKDYNSLNEYKWYYHQGYATRSKRIGKRKDNKSITIRLHRVIINAKENEEVDHINGDTLDNRRNNLRIATRQENNFNRRKFNKYKFKGVDINKSKWRARIRFNKKDIHLGYFLNELEAAEAYNKAAIKYFGEYAKLNKTGE